jgi:DNA mismatch endonuclease (patch repair protein)
MTAAGRPQRLVPRAPPASSAAARAVMRGNRSQETRPERALRSVLHRRGLRFRKHYALLPSGRCRADIAFPRPRVAIFVDGCFWHGCPDHGSKPRTNSLYWHAKIERNVARDREQNALLSEAGWQIVRIWEHEDPATAADLVQGVLASAEA